MDKKTYHIIIGSVIFILVIFVTYTYVSSKDKKDRSRDEVNNSTSFQSSEKSSGIEYIDENLIAHYRGNVPVPSQAMKETNEQYTHFNIQDRNERLKYIQLSDQQANNIAQNYIRSSKFLRTKRANNFSPYSYKNETQENNLCNKSKDLLLNPSPDSKSSSAKYEQLPGTIKSDDYFIPNKF